MRTNEKYLAIYSVVRRIPLGKVATYGQIAALAGFPGQARQVGYALNSLPDDMNIPWQRVVNAKGRISRRADQIFEEIQYQILVSEGIAFDLRGYINLELFQWEPGNDKN